MTDQRPAKVPRLAAGRARAQGLPTRGTTAPNRLRRMDRFILNRFGPLLRAADQPLVIDLGFGDSPATTLELCTRLRALRSDISVIGLEIDAERVAQARPAATTGLSFEVGGFELGGHRPLLVRAANVLRQYPEPAVAPAWDLMRGQLAAGGVLVEGTTDEFGRRCTWVQVSAAGPVSLTLSCAVAHLQTPSSLAERLVKALIHRNVPGQHIYALLKAIDAAWLHHAPLAPFGPNQRWQAMCETVADQWPVLSSRREHRLGEITVAWSALQN